MGRSDQADLLVDRDGVKELIPHREPILLLDGLTVLIPGKSAVGVKYVDPDDYFLAGHFPENPIMPGVLMVEALAQTGACALMGSKDAQGKLVMFAGIDRVRFRRPVRPGDTLNLSVEIDRIRGPIGRGQAVATVDGEVAVEGRLTFALVDEEGATE